MRWSRLVVNCVNETGDPSWVKYCFSEHKVKAFGQFG